MKDNYTLRIEQEQLLKIGFIIQKVDCDRRIEPIEAKKTRLQAKKREIEQAIVHYKNQLAIIKQSPAAEALIKKTSKYRAKKPTKIGLIARAIGYGISYAAMGLRNKEAFGESHNYGLIGTIGANALTIGGVGILEGTTRYLADVTRIENITNQYSLEFLEECLANKEAELEKCNKFISAANAKLRKEYTLRGQAQAGIDTTDKNIENITSLREKAAYIVFMKMYGEALNKQYDLNTENGEIRDINEAELTAATSTRRSKAARTQEDKKMMEALQEQLRITAGEAGAALPETKKKKTATRKPRAKKDDATATPKRQRRSKANTYMGEQITFDMLAAQASAPQEAVAPTTEPKVEEIRVLNQTIPMDPFKEDAITGVPVRYEYTEEEAARLAAEGLGDTISLEMLRAMSTESANSQVIDGARARAK